jgi:hypothetical protein
VNGSATIDALDKDQSLIVLEGSGGIGEHAARAGQVFLLPAQESTSVSGNLSLLRTFV